jgi:predicted PurR-regulated permease PerM
VRTLVAFQQGPFSELLMNAPIPALAVHPIDARAAVLGRIYSLLRIALVATAIIIAVWLLSDLLTVIFAAALLAVILHGVSNLFRRVTGLPYWLSLTFVTFIILALLVGLGFIAGPGLGDQVTKLRQVLGQQMVGLHDRLGHTQWGKLILQQVPGSLGGDKAGSAATITSGFAGSVAGFVGSAFGLFGTLAVVLIAALYLAAAPGSYVNGAMRLVPVPHRPKAKELFAAAGSALWAWSAGQALDMLVVGVLSGVGLWLLGVPLALVLGVVAGLFNFVPYIGAMVGAVPAIIIAFSVGSTTGIETMILYAVIQGFEGNVMAPLIQKRAVHMPPGLTILSQTAFGAILGIPGLIFATPLTAAILAVMSKATTPLAEDEKV